MILFPRKQDNDLSEEVNKSMETNKKIVSSVFTETERQALWLASLKANTEVVYDPDTQKWTINYYEEA